MGSGMSGGNFSVTFPDGTTQPFSGAPADAAEKAARQLEPSDSPAAAKQDPTRVYVWPSEFGMERRDEQIELLVGDDVPANELPYTPVRIFDVWAWDGEAPEDGPDWQPDTVVRSDVEEVGTIGET